MSNFIRWVICVGVVYLYIELLDRHNAEKYKEMLKRVDTENNKIIAYLEKEVAYWKELKVESKNDNTE